MALTAKEQEYQWGCFHAEAARVAEGILLSLTCSCIGNEMNTVAEQSVVSVFSLILCN